MALLESLKKKEDGAALTAATELLVKVSRPFSPRGRRQMLTEPRSFEKVDYKERPGIGEMTRKDWQEEKLGRVKDMLQASFEERDRKRPRMWRSFAATTTISAVSSVLLYFLSRTLEKRSEESPLCTEAVVADPPAAPETSSKRELVAWVVQKVLAPVILFGVLSAIRKFVIEREIDLLEYRNNGTANFLINSLSKAVFFAAKECPKLLKRELWACILTFIVELAGSLILW